MAKSSINLSKTNYAFYCVFGLVTYFIWCDLSFFGALTAEKAQSHTYRNATLTSQKTIKLRMQDHFGHYVFLPFCEWADKTFGISQISWVTPNVITAIHFCIAIISGRLMASKFLSVRRIAVVLYETRSMLDAMDGVVFRAQSKNQQFISGWGTYGYMIDGLADTIGGLFLMCGTIYRLNKYLPFRNPEVLAKLKYKFNNGGDEESGERLLAGEESCSEEAVEAYGLKKYSRQTVNFTVVFFTITVILRSGLWDHFNHSYHDLLGTVRSDIPPEKQIEVLGYGSTWFSLWLWTIHSADAFMHFTLVAIFFGKLWQWLRFNLYFSIPNILMVSLICQIHLMQMRNLLGVPH